MSIQTYKTIKEKGNSEFKDRGSKFLGFSFPFSDVEKLKAIIKELKDQHPKAIHFCYAYRIGIDENNFRANDDGEPSGSAGKPILAQIDSFGITNVLVVVIRYWGGVLLGVPGLINAYKTACYETLINLNIEEKSVLKNYKLQFNYTLLNEIMRVIKHYQLEVLTSEMSLFCEYKVGIPVSIEAEVIEKFHAFYELNISES